ncbi:MAG: hypothetical protein IT370_27315 [Deltaproteobacteria bacterium]|nr:hypothetical protein [Deltaproteobacteria bacterium]
MPPVRIVELSLRGRLPAGRRLGRAAGFVIATAAPTDVALRLDQRALRLELAPPLALSGPFPLVGLHARAAGWGFAARALELGLERGRGLGVDASALVRAGLGKLTASALGGLGVTRAGFRPLDAEGAAALALLRDRLRGRVPALLRGADLLGLGELSLRVKLTLPDGLAAEAVRVAPGAELVIEARAALATWLAGGPLPNLEVRGPLQVVGDAGAPAHRDAGLRVLRALAAAHPRALGLELARLLGIESPGSPP